MNRILFLSFRNYGLFFVAYIYSTGHIPHCLLLRKNVLTNTIMLRVTGFMLRFELGINIFRNSKRFNVFVFSH